MTIFLYLAEEVGWDLYIPFDLRAAVYVTSYGKCRSQQDCQQPHCLLHCIDAGYAGICIPSDGACSRFLFIWQLIEKPNQQCQFQLSSECNLGSYYDKKQFQKTSKPFFSCLVTVCHEQGQTTLGGKALRVLLKHS